MDTNIRTATDGREHMNRDRWIGTDGWGLMDGD